MPPEPQPGWVRIAVRAAGICGSDLHNFSTGQWITRAPSVAGHEFMGTVTALGIGVEGLAIGDRVAADSRVWCGVCPACRGGHRHLCATLGFIGEALDGGFAEYALLPQRLAHKLPVGLADDIAAMAEPFAVALYAVNRLALNGDERILIAGCGPIGGLAALVLSERGHKNVLVADRNAKRLARVCEVTGARPIALDDLANEAISAAIEATGSVSALRAVLAGVASGARIALVGIAHRTFDLDPNILVEREISLIGCHAFRDELPDAIAMLGICAPRAAKFIDRDITLDDVPEAYRRLIAGEAVGLKTIIRMKENSR